MTTDVAPAHDLRSRNSWLEGLHIAGSVASVTGLSLLTLNKAVPSISIGEILGWLGLVSLLLAFVTLLLLALRRTGAWFQERFGHTGRNVFWLSAVPGTNSPDVRRGTGRMNGARCLTCA